MSDWPTGTNFVGNETPGGTINGSNGTFTLAYVPKSSTLQLFKRSPQNQTWVLFTNYSLSGKTITITSGYEPLTGEEQLAFYSRQE